MGQGLTFSKPMKTKHMKANILWCINSIKKSEWSDCNFRAHKLKRKGECGLLFFLSCFDGVIGLTYLRYEVCNSFTLGRREDFDVRKVSFTHNFYTKIYACDI